MGSDCFVQLSDNILDEHTHFFGNFSGFFFREFVEIGHASGVKPNKKSKFQNYKLLILSSYDFHHLLKNDLTSKWNCFLKKKDSSLLFCVK